MEEKEETVKTHVSLTTAVCILTLSLSTLAQGVVIPLSTHSSADANQPVPASWLDATMELSVNQNGADWELSVAITNDTPENVGDIEFDISELYINTSAPITSLTLLDVAGGDKNKWNLNLDYDNILVGPFGYFDISLISNGSVMETIDSGETFTFTMLIDGTAASYLDTDFFALSTEKDIDDKILAYGAAKFIRGGIDDLSAYGAYVPEPATIILLGLGAICLLRRRRS
jgi:hypothetical protein